MPHRNQHSVEIDRSPADVFPYLVGSDERMGWMSALKESRQVTEGDPGLGTRFHDVFEQAGQRVEIDAEVTEWQPSERLVLRLGARMFEATGLQELEDLGGRTRLTTTIDTEYTSTMVRLMAGAITRHAQTQLEQDLARLKQLLETEA